MRIHPSPRGQRMCTTQGVHVRDRFSRAHARLVLLVLLTALCTGCAKTVKWEEEVLLNTGETIWVSKKVRYSIKGQPGNPLDLGYVPDRIQTITFTYKNTKYSYEGDAGIMLLAISPHGKPMVVAHPGYWGWYARHNYPVCARPFYVQLMPDESGRTWTWPNQIEEWTYHLPANIMRNMPDPSRAKHRYTMHDKSSQGFMHDPRIAYMRKVDPQYKNLDCQKEKLQ